MTWEEREKKVKERGLKTAEDFANILDVSATLVRTWIKDAIVETELIGGVKYIKFGNSLVKLIKHYRKKADNKQERKDREQLINEKLQAEIDLKNTQNELHIVRRNIQEGLYLLAKNVMDDIIKYNNDVKNFVLSLPSMFINMIQSDVKDKKVLKERQAQIESMVSKMLNDFVDRLTDKVEADGKIELNEKGEERKKRGRKKNS